MRSAPAAVPFAPDSYGCFVAVNVPELSGVPPIPIAMLDPHESTQADPDCVIGLHDPLMFVDDEKVPVTFAETVDTSG